MAHMEKGEPLNSLKKEFRGDLEKAITYALRIARAGGENASDYAQAAHVMREERNAQTGRGPFGPGPPNW